MKVKDLYYDIETLFIEGHSAKQIAAQLGIPVEDVQEVLDDFGVDPHDVDAADWDELEAFDSADF